MSPSEGKIMNRPLVLLVLVPIVLRLQLPSQAEQPAPAPGHVRIANLAEGAHCTEVSALVGERMVIVGEDRQAEIAVAVRKLPPDKQAVIYVELRPRQRGKTGTVPMGLPVGRWFRLVNVNSGHCLSVQDRSRNAGAKLVQHDIAATDDGLLWRLIPAVEGWYFLQNRTSEQVASLPDDRKDAGANLVQVPVDKGHLDQQWRPLWLEGNRFVVVNRRSGLALAVAYGALHSGAIICQWPLNIDWSQHQWRIEVVDLQ
jgi:hypothetical protein